MYIFHIKINGSIRMVVRKTTSKTIYKVTASYTGAFRTLNDAKQAQARIKANPSAQVAPVKKTPKGYSFGVKFDFIAPSVKARDQAAKGAKAQGARVSIKTMKV